MKFLLFFILTCNLFTCHLFAKPNLLLLEKYKDQNVTGWLMSEKLDGIRAIWNGKNLKSRSGKILHAPRWFLQGFPPFSIDGELWSKRGEFENIQSIVMDAQPSKDWAKLTYNIFEIPKQNGTLTQRLQILKKHLKTHKAPYIRVIPQITCKNKAHLLSFFNEVTEKGGEGIVLREPNTPYIAKRTRSALKMKKFDDTECQVVALHKGKGKYKNLLGSFTCQLKNGVRFKIGSGLDDKQRKNFIKIGDIITFRYQGFTKHKKPRFPTFLRKRKKL